MDRYSQYTAMILTLLMLCFSLVAHWLACVWFVIAEKEQTVNDIDWDIGKYLPESFFFFFYIYHKYFSFDIQVCT